MQETAHYLASNGSASDKLHEWSSFIGIVTAIVGNILISFALNIQRYAHIRLGNEQHGKEEAYRRARRHPKGYGTQQQGKIAEQRADVNLNAPAEDGELTEGEGRNGRGSFMPGPSPHSCSSSESSIKQSEKPQEHPDRKSYLRSPYWWAGIVLMVVGEAGNFLAYGFASASIVSPLGVVALVSNCIIAPCLLKERFRQRDLWGVLVAVAGAVVVVLSAKNSEHKMGPKDIWDAITRWEFELYLGITAAAIVVLMWASGKYGERSIVIDLGLVGLYGGYTALSTKGVASLLSYTLWRAFTFPITYLLIFILVTSALLQIRYVNRALQRFDSTQVIPTQFVLFTISVIIGSTVLYRDFESATAERVGKFVGGCILTFMGVYLITSARGTQRDEDTDDEDIDDEEHAIGLIDEERYQDEISPPRSPSKSSNRRKPSTNLNPTPQRRSYQNSDGPSSLPQTPQRLSSHTSNASDPFRPSSPSDLATPLLENPWQSSQEALVRPRTLENTVSTPLFRTTTDPTTPLRGSSRSSPKRTNERPSAVTRSSVARMLPGPLTSPLSSPLSAIVRDTQRRGLGPAARRRQAGIEALNRAERSQRSSASGGENNNNNEINIMVSTGEEGREDDNDGNDTSSPFAHRAQRPGLLGNPASSPKGRAFSVSLGEFFRGKRKSGEGQEQEERGM